METTARGWNVLERENAILWREYTFGGGVATTFVFRGAGDGLIGRFEPLEALAPLLGERATAIDPPGHKVGNAIATVRGSHGSYWYSSDLFANIPKLPSNIVLRLLMSITHKAPGYRLFRPAVWLQVKDKKLVRDWIDDVMTKAAPTTVVPAHGPPITGTDVPEKTKALAAEI
ncbi:MAG TPA: hypothetical protein VEK07_14015 [Polyangiaceae bacterium]|nr:hypothetical protein [Polyangiaceae bacterium]